MYFFVDFQEFKTFNQRPPTFGGPTQNKKSQNSNFMQLTDRYSYNLNKFDTSKVFFKEICPKTHVFLIHF